MITNLHSYVTYSDTFKVIEKLNETIKELGFLVGTVDGEQRTNSTIQRYCTGIYSENKKAKRDFLDKLLFGKDIPHWHDANIYICEANDPFPSDTWVIYVFGEGKNGEHVNKMLDLANKLAEKFPGIKFPVVLQDRYFHEEQINDYVGGG